jgi:exodeoxyribonuclease V alpha subunit
MADLQTLTGSVERVTYYNEENGYSVIRILPDEAGLPGANRNGEITVTGNLPELAPGEHLTLRGEWSNHPKFGMQFEAKAIEQSLPATAEGIKRYLSSGLIAGIGPVLAERIVGHFGAQTIEVLDENPLRLREVPDIGPKRSQQIIASWEEQKQVKEIMLFLTSHNVSSNLAVKIYKHYGDDALGIVQRNPYQLARDIYGVGFKTADGIARNLGLPTDHPTRIEAGVIFALEEMTYEGHVFTPREVLKDKAVELLGVERALIEPALNDLAESELIVMDSLPLGEDGAAESDNAIYSAIQYVAERNAARRLIALNEALPSRLLDIAPMFVELPKSLNKEQGEAVHTALSQPVSILTGGPGTGKTTTLNALMAVVENAGKRYALASPTGRAAKRLAEATGKAASTLHRLLDYSPAEGFKRGEDNPLEIDLLVVDEASMLDTILLNATLRALEPGTHLLLVGDADQLPSVGAGDVLRDLINSGELPVTRLMQIYRQAADSYIIENAHRINRGEAPETPKEALDFFRFPAQSAEEAADWVVKLVRERIPERFNLDPFTEIQVLAPMYRGPAGITSLNERLQEALNPGGPLIAEKRLFGQTFRPGDKVMQTKNDYEKGVFNGDIGMIEEISSVDNLMLIEFEGRKIDYPFSDADQLVLGYAVSVHKAQGSEFPAIVLPLLTQHYMMLQRNLFYTAVTRAQKLCVLVSNPRAMAIAVKNNEVAKRWTGLKWRVSGAATLE